MVFSCVIGPLVSIASMHAVCCAQLQIGTCVGFKRSILAQVLFTACKTLIVTGHILAMLAVACTCTVYVGLQTFATSVQFASSRTLFVEHQSISAECV